MSIQEMRCRRGVAARRLPPLGCGHSDPLDCPRAPLTVESARAAWHHLGELGLIDDEGFIAAILRDDAA